ALRNPHPEERRRRVSKDGRLHCRCPWPSFETPASQAPQDEVWKGNRRMRRAEHAAPNAPNEKNQVQVIARAAAILRALEDERHGLSLGEIAQRANLARSTVQRIVAALETEKIVIAASPNGRVRLGPTILRLASSVRTDFVDLARPFIVSLSRE